MVCSERCPLTGVCQGVWGVTQPHSGGCFLLLFPPHGQAHARFHATGLRSWECPGQTGLEQSLQLLCEPRSLLPSSLASSVCVPFLLAGKLPSGFYCSFEEGDCGWMPGSSASHPSPWRIGSAEHKRFPSIEGV